MRYGVVTNLILLWGVTKNVQYGIRRCPYHTVAGGSPEVENGPILTKNEFTKKLIFFYYISEITKTAALECTLHVLTPPTPTRTVSPTARN